AGGFIFLGGGKAAFLSAGPPREYPVTPRFGPGYFLPCGGASALSGVLSGGRRSGSLFRLCGPRGAGPQPARPVAKVVGGTPLPPATNIPTTLPEMEKRGGGDLPPP